MHQRNTKTLGRSGQSYQSVAREESMHIVKSGQDDVLVPSSENGGSVYQYIKTQMFESLGHISGIVIAENRQTTMTTLINSASGPVEAASGARRRP